MDEANSKSSVPPPPTSPSATNPSDGGAAPAIDKTFYTWSNFFSILTGFSSDSDRQKYLHTRDLINEQEDCATCEKNKKWLFKHSPLITFLKTEIDALGPGDGSASISEKNVRCRRCGDGAGEGHAQSGGFSPDHGILLCANKLRNKGHLEDTLAHEMVHAYDYMRFKLDPYDLRHAACMEIRASTLSGECRFSREFFTRGQWSLTQQLQECVRRRAALSVAGRPGCRDDVQAVRVVNEVWESCFGDLRPFDEIYR